MIFHWYLGILNVKFSPQNNKTHPPFVSTDERRGVFLEVFLTPESPEDDSLHGGVRVEHAQKLLIMVRSNRLIVVLDTEFRYPDRNTSFSESIQTRLMKLKKRIHS